MADFAGVGEPVDVVDFDRWLLDSDRRQMVHRALMGLSEQQRHLIVMLFADPAPSYAEISASLAMPIGSIGPTRQRLLGKLRDAVSGEEGRNSQTPAEFDYGATPPDHDGYRVRVGAALVAGGVPAHIVGTAAQNGSGSVCQVRS